MEYTGSDTVAPLDLQHATIEENWKEEGYCQAHELEASIQPRDASSLFEEAQPPYYHHHHMLFIVKNAKDMKFNNQFSWSEILSKISLKRTLINTFIEIILVNAVHFYFQTLNIIPKVNQIKNIGSLLHTFALKIRPFIKGPEKHS